MTLHLDLASNFIARQPTPAIYTTKSHFTAEANRFINRRAWPSSMEASAPTEKAATDGPDGEQPKPAVDDAKPVPAEKEATEKPEAPKEASEGET